MKVIKNIIKFSLIVYIILIVNTTISKADTIYWANNIVGFSSQMGTKEFSANQILSKPSIMPEQGKSSTAWMPHHPTDKIEWIRVKFPEKIYVSQIIVNENLNPGAIVKLILYDSLSQGHLVFSNNLVSNRTSIGKLSKYDIAKTEFRTNELKIEVNIINYIEQYQIDAVGIADYNSNYKVEMNLSSVGNSFQKVKLGSTVNSPYKELAPIISQDGKHLVFTREGHPDNIGDNKKQDVWISDIDNEGNFREAVNIGAPVNNENANYAISTSTNANSLFLGNIYMPDGTSRAGFSVSRYDGNAWSKPDSLIIDNYYNLFVTSSACMANNEKVLIISTKRNDSYGKTDLYVSTLKDNGTWSEPLNLGPKVNTAEEELSPFLAGDNKTLYFSSAGLPGFGSNDMYMTRRLDDTWQNWSEPINLGSSINTPEWDAYYTITADGKYAYFVSSAGFGSSEDIYRIELPIEVKPEIVVLVSGKVLNQKDNKPIGAKITYEVLPEGTEAGIAQSNSQTGEYSIILPAGQMYGFLASADNFISINENINLKEIEEYIEIKRDLYLAPIEKGQIIRINNIFFNYNEYELLSESFSELKRIVKVLDNNPNMKIAIQGHTDNIGNDNFNKKLSLNRAKAVYNFLVENGIDKKRLEIKGFGRSNPISENDTEEGRARNRRVEFVILEN